jgi:NAD+ synthase (glutamine-hydrolysing)
VNPTTPKIDFTIYQMNSFVGSIEGNKEKIIGAIKSAEQKKTDILIFPELALSGYLPQDLFLYPSLIESIEQAVSEILQFVDQTFVVLGTPTRINSELKQTLLRNSALILHQGKVFAETHKILMPNYDVFNESRYFLPVKEPLVVEICGLKIGVQICEDMWDHLPYHQTNVTSLQHQAGADVIINISASPFSKSKPSDRLETVTNHVSRHKIPFIYVNMVGGQDDIIFDGRSFVVNNQGELSYVAPAFHEGLFEIPRTAFSLREENDPLVSYYASDEKEITSAIVLNLQDYLRKASFQGKLIIASSGGIDSALTTCLATLAVGKDRVVTIYMPSKYSSAQSRSDAATIAKNLDVEFYEFPINDLVQQFNEGRANLQFIDQTWSVADENIQARIRGNILMYIANKIGGMVISTGNKSEISVGYCTLYGDTVGGKNLIGDLYKREVYKIGRYLNTLKDSIPETVFTKAPSAELHRDQKDSDSLPEYPILDAILELLIDQNMSTTEIINNGHPKNVVEQVARLVKTSEFKRAQIAQTVKVSDRAFGKGRIVPTTSGFMP